MEGENGGVVAVVQALQCAGLAVTVMGGRQSVGSVIAINQLRQEPCATSTVVTSTNALHSTSVDAAAQICDDRYTSSYQLAHCHARPSSPPVQLTEFPPQRPEPCRTQGNFEIGESKSPLIMSPIQSQTVRNSYTSVDRSLLNSRPSRCTASFADSLRRYPSISPNRSISSELVQRLLVYTQAKNFSKGSYHTKSLRSIRSKTPSPKEVITKTKSTKSVQTYTRAKVKENLTGEDKDNVKGDKKKRPRSPTKSLKDVRHRDNHVNATYDYLKSTSPRRYNAVPTDVRYLSDVTRCLRDTLRQICEDRPVVCPNVQNRYSQHRREHHRVSQESSTDSNNTPTASNPMVSTGVPAMSSCEAMEGTYRPTCPARPKLCCYCQKPIPCSCPKRSSVQFQRNPQIIRKPSIDSEVLTRSRFVTRDVSSCVCPKMTLDEFDNKVNEQVFNWLDEVPVYANDKPEDRRVRLDMASKLVEKLKGLKDDEDFEVKAKNEIAECVSNMPMWCPGNKENQDMFKQQIADSLFDKVRNISQKIDKFEEQISKFVDGLNLKTRDSQGQVIDKKNVVDNLVNRLKPLALNQATDPAGYKDALKSEIVDILQGLPIKLNGDEKVYLSNLADNLATQLHTIPATDIIKQPSLDSLEGEFQKQIWEWLEDVPEFSNATQGSENQKSVKALAKKLQKIQSRGIEDSKVQEQMQNEINEWLETTIGKKARLDPNTKSNLAEKLVGMLVNVSKSSDKKQPKLLVNEEKMTEQILDWLNEIPELSTGNEKEKKKKVEQLARNLCKLRSQGKSDMVVEDEILNWLVTSFESKGKRIDARSQDTLTNKLLSKIKALSNVQEDDNLMQNIWNCLDNIPELDKSSNESKRLVEQLANKIHELHSQNQGEISDETIKEEINSWLNNLSKDTGAILNTKTRNQLMLNLMNIAKAAPIQRKRWSTQDNLQQAISDEIASILGGSTFKLANGNKKDVQNKISKLLSRNIDSVKSGDDNKEIKTKIIDILEQDAQLPTTKARKVADNIISKVQGMKKPELSISMYSDKLKNTLREEVGLILDESNIHGDNRDQIETILTDVLTDQVMHGESEELSKDRLLNALRDSDIPKDQTEEIASKLIDRAKEVSLSQKIQDSTVQLSNLSKSRGYEALSPMHREMFKDSAENEIVDFIQELTGDSSHMSTKKYKAAAEKLAQRVGDIMSQTDTTATEKRDSIEIEISKCLQSLSVNTDGTKASELADKLQNLATTTSTPKRSSFERYTFRPRRDSKSSTISAIDDSHFKMPAPTEEEEQYMNKLATIIDDWMSNLPLDLNTEDGKGLKEVMIRDLAGDIIDRQKYLQLNPDAKISDDEELEHLKYQVFRWLNKVPNLKEILPSIAKTDYLMDRIKGVPVPQLTKSPELFKERRSSRQKDSNVQNFSEELSSLENEIQDWIRAVPSKFYATRDGDFHQKLVKDLAQQIHQLHKDEELTEHHIEDIVTDFLRKILKEYNEQYFNSLTEGLKGVLINKGLITLLESSVLASNSSIMMQQNLNSFLLDWLKEKPLYQKRLSKEKREQEKLIEELSKSLKDTFRAPYPSTEHKEERVLDEIKSHLKRFPMESRLRLDEEFHDSTANDLLEYLKMFDLFQSVVDLQSQTQMHSESEIEGIIPLLEEWIGSLPLMIRKPSVENKKIDSLKKELAKTLHELKQQHPSPNESASNILKEEIKKYIHQLPLEPAKKKDAQFISNKIEELHQKLLGVQSRLKTSNTPSISEEGVKDILLNWGKNLPFNPGKSIEKSKPEIDKTAPKIKAILTKEPLHKIENTKTELEHEIKTLVKKLPLQRHKVKDDHISELTNQLHEYAKTAVAGSPNMTAESSFSSKSGYKKAADVLYDNVADWCDKLPIDSGSTPEEKEKVETLKQNIASKIINVIGDLNVNPEVFNDDALYEDLLNDEIDNLLNKLPLTSETENNLPALKENLIEKVKEAKAKTQDELAGQAYKQQLRDAISKTLPSIDDLKAEEKAPFEVLKDNLADAYINLHFAAGDEEMKRELKNKISDEIQQFCEDYLQRYPATPVDAKKLNRELYSVLQKVPIPKDETIKSQVEQVRIKDKIHDWIKELPLKEDESPTDQLQRNKIVTVLAKRLHDIEKEKEFNPDLDAGERMQKEIKKWVKKLPIQPGQEDKAEEMVEQLVFKLKDTEESRRLSVTNIRHSVDTAEDRRPCEFTCPFYSKFDNPAVEAPSRYLSQYVPPFPTSSLSSEDRAHLERIRERNKRKQLYFEPFAQALQPPCQCRDASVNPIPIDAGSQTDVGPSSAKAIQSQMDPSEVHTSGPDFTPCGQPPGSPQVVVKEYYWDSPDSTLRETGNVAPCGQGQSNSYQGQSLPCRPQQSPQYSWPQSHVDLPPTARFGQPSPQGMFSSPDQSGMSQAPCMVAPPMPTPQLSMVQQPRQPQSPCMSTNPQMPSRSPYLSPTPQTPYMSQGSQASRVPQPQIRSQQSPCVRQPTPIPSQPSRTQPYPSAPPMPPYMMSTPSPQVRSPYMNQPDIPISHSPHISQTPSMKTPQMSHQQMPPCALHEIPHHRSRHIPPCQSQEHRETRKPFRQPCFGSPEISSSSPFDTGPEIGPKVTRLGSLDGVPCSKTCGSQSPRMKRSQNSPDDEYNWSIRFPEDDRFWGTPCPRRRAHRSPARSPERVFVKENERKEEKTRCRCRERVITKCMGRRPQTCNHACQLDEDSLSHCSRCCGAHCPHPSYLFFR